MTRQEQHLHNQQIIELLKSQVAHGFRAPSYQSVVQLLNVRNLKTSTGNPWTRKALLRMLQRQGISGLHGLLTKLAASNGEQ